MIIFESNDSFFVSRRKKIKRINDGICVIGLINELIDNESVWFVTNRIRIRVRSAYRDRARPVRVTNRSSRCRRRRHRRLHRPGCVTQRRRRRPRWRPATASSRPVSRVPPIGRRPPVNPASIHLQDPIRIGFTRKRDPLGSLRDLLGIFDFLWSFYLFILFYFF